MRCEVIWLPVIFTDRVFIRPFSIYFKTDFNDRGGLAA